MRTAFVRCGVRVTLETARRRGRCRSTRWRWSSATRAPLASRATLGTARQAGPPSASGRIGGRRAPSTAAWSGPSLLLRARGRALEAVRAGARVRRAARFAQLVAGAGEGSSRTHLVLMRRCKLRGAVLESRRDQERSSVSRNDRSCCNNLETSPDGYWKRCRLIESQASFTAAGD